VRQDQVEVISYSRWDSCWARLSRPLIASFGHLEVTVNS